MAVPLPLRVPVPRVVDPSLNVTAPVGMPPVLVTVALKVTELPYADGLADDIGTLVVVDDKPTLRVPEPVLPKKLVPCAGVNVAVKVC